MGRALPQKDFRERWPAHGSAWSEPDRAFCQAERAKDNDSHREAAVAPDKASRGLALDVFCFFGDLQPNGVWLDDTNWHGTKADGTYRTVVLPGPGLITVRSTYDRYRMGVGVDRIKGNGVEGGFELIRTRPFLLHRGNYHVLVPINPEPGAESITCDVELGPGRTLKGIVIGPDGQPLAGA
jgi:hypothetical protein